MSRDRDCGVAFYSGGNWNNGANAGLFALNGNNPRSNSIISHLSVCCDAQFLSALSRFSNDVIS